MAVVDHILEDDLRLYASGSLSADDLTTVDAHVRTCTVCSTRLEEIANSVTRAPEGSAARRREPRIPTSENATLQVLQPLSLERMLIKIVNTSKNGLGLELGSSLPPRARVQIKFRRTVVVAEVLHCERKDDTFYAGVRIEDVRYAPSDRHDQ